MSDRIPDLMRTQDALNRRTFLKYSAGGIGMAALGSLLGPGVMASITGMAGGPTKATATAGMPSPNLGLPELPHFPAKAKRVIYLFQSGAPSQLDLWDYKPELESRRGKDLP